MVNPAGGLDQSESRRVWTEAAGALMTGNVLLSGRDGPTLTASPTLTPRPDRTVEQDTHRWKTLGHTGGGRAILEDTGKAKTRRRYRTLVTLAKLK